MRCIECGGCYMNEAARESLCYSPGKGKDDDEHDQLRGGSRERAAVPKAPR